MTMPDVTAADRVAAAIARVNAALAETRNPQTLLLTRRYACQRLEMALPPLAADDTVVFYEQMRADLEHLRDRVRTPHVGVDDDPALVRLAETYAIRLVVWAGMSADAH